jgi:hypothetical protein
MKKKIIFCILKVTEERIRSWIRTKLVTDPNTVPNYGFFPLLQDSAWVFIGGLPYELTEGDVICVFSQYGEVVHINLIRDHTTGKSRVSQAPKNPNFCKDPKYFFAGLRIRIRIQSGQWIRIRIRIQEGKNDQKKRSCFEVLDGTF